MGYFFFHPQNAVAKRLKAENEDTRVFTYINRAEMEFKIQNLMSRAGMNVWPTFHTVIGSLAGGVDKHIALNEDDTIERNVAKLCKSSPAPWSYVKILNGSEHNCVIGYCSSSPTSPFAMSVTEMAQKGIIQADYVPRPV